MNRFFRVTQLAMLSLCLVAIAHADLKVKQRRTTGGQTLENTVMIKGERQRTESPSGDAQGVGQVNILQCDLRRMLLINDSAHRYLVYPLDQAAAGVGAETT